MPRILLGARKRNAQVTTGDLNALTLAKVWVSGRVISHSSTSSYILGRISNIAGNLSCDRKQLYARIAYKVLIILGKITLQYLDAKLEALALEY